MDAMNEWDLQGVTFTPYDENRRDEPYLDGPLARSPFDSPDGPLIRLQAYKNAWDKCLRRIQEVVHTLQKPVINSVVDSVQAAYHTDDLILPSSELVVLVVSCSDRANLHAVLARMSSRLRGERPVGLKIDDECSPSVFISCLSELHCTNASATLRSLIGGFISQPLGNKGGVSLTPKIKPTSSLAVYDMKKLETWYELVKDKYGSNAPTLVVLIHDVHAIDPAVLRDTLEICSLHVPHLPLVFLFGTSVPNLLQAVLPRSTLACIRLERHVLPWNVNVLEYVFRETFFSLKFTPDVMLGPVGFKTIFEEFKKHNSTLDAMLSMLQLLHMQHFYHPLSFIADPTSDVVFQDIDDSPPEEWRPFFKLLRQYCIPEIFGTTETDHTRWSSSGSQEIVRNVLGARTRFRLQGDQIKVAFKVLETILSFIRSHGENSPIVSFERLGLEALCGSLVENILEISNILKRMSLNQVEALLEELYHLLHNLPSNVRNNAIELKQKVVIVKNAISANFVLDFIVFLESFFMKSFIPFKEVRFLDIWWTGETSIPHSPFNPNPHMSIVTALLEPQEYLGWLSSTQSYQRKELSALPDACVLFRRYVESGKMINLYDWYDSFSLAMETEALEPDDGTTVDVDESIAESKGKRTAKTSLKRKLSGGQDYEEREVTQKHDHQARFMRSMHELEYVGFIKSTGRKADHVVKTVFDALD